MSFLSRSALPRRLAASLASAIVAVPWSSVNAQQREVKPPAAAQGFAAGECPGACVVDSLVIDIDRGRRAQSGTATATIVVTDTVLLARRGSPPAPRERLLQLWVACDSTPCASAVVPGRISDKRIDDARVVRRVVATWVLPAALLQKLLRTRVISLNAEGQAHAVSGTMQVAVVRLLESIRAAIPVATMSPRMRLHLASFAAFGVPGDSTLAEDVGTATEPLMMPATATTPPTRVATLTLVGRGPDAHALLVQDDATGSAPIFGVGEVATIALPGRTGRRGTVTGKLTARQRVEVLRDSCQGMKIWTYLVSLSAADMAAVLRGAPQSPRPDERVDRWLGTAVREPIAARQSPAEQRAITASRTVVAQFVRERANTGVRDRDVQVLATLPRGGGYITNFGLLQKEGSGWRFPSFTLRAAACP